jgi:dihydropteroate synthase
MTKLVGIVNFTPNSFSDGGHPTTANAVLMHKRALVVCSTGPLHTARF